MKRFAVLIVSASLGGALCAQTIVENAAAAAAGAAAGVGVGKSVGSVLKGVNRTLEQSTAKPPGVEAPDDTMKPLKGSALAVRPAPRRGVPMVKTAKTSRQPASTAALPEPPAAPPKIDLEELARMQPGVTRQDLLAKVGPPSIKLTLPESGHEVEIYRYRANGHDTAVVKLQDGVVASIELLAR